MEKGRLSGIVESVFGKARKDSAEKAGGKQGPGEEPETHGGPVSAVEQDEVFSEDQGIFGKVYVLSLNEFYEALGGRSGRLAESLLLICESVFAERTGPHDGFSLVGDDHYVFRFGNLDDRKALITAANIIEEIGTKLLGESFIKSGQFKAILATVGAGQIVDADGALDEAKVSAAAEAARAAAAKPAAAAAADEPQWRALNHVDLAADNKWVGVGAAAGEENQWRALDRGKKKDDIQWQVLEHKKEKKKDDIEWQVLVPE